MRRVTTPAIFVLLLALIAGLAWANDDLAVDENGVSSPYLIPGSRVNPDYPPAAFSAKREGTVVMAVKVLANGRVGEVSVLESTDPKLGFEQYAERAISKWRFEPALKNGQPVEAYSVVRLSFVRRKASGGDKGYVVGGFLAPSQMGGSITGMPSSSTVAAAAAGISLAGTDQRTGVRTPNSPCGSIGCLYDRTKLLPPPADGVNQPRTITGPGTGF